MGRWEPGAEGRLREAALELYVDRGFEQTTVADIAEAAGVTARTFFRYFADKREVLFDGSDQLLNRMLDGLESVTEDATPLDAVGAALQAAGQMIGGDLPYSRRRWQVISTNAELRERELSKMERIAAALADGLRGRGVPDPHAGLAAEAGVAVFRVGYERWVSGAAGKTSLEKVLADGLADLRALASG